jgi:ribosome-associated toxin RatA of RatAB toxin-antitoxin module
MELRKSVLVSHSAEEMFDLIEAAEHYPDFLPWCAATTIVERDDSVVVADIEIDVHGVRFGIRTRNPKRRPAWMAIQLERGPFRRFHGEWHLTPLTADGCRIEFDLRYDFDHSVVGRLASPVFDRIANTLVDAYVARADRMHAMTALSAPAVGVAAPTHAAEAEAAAPPAPNSTPRANEPPNRSEPT